jgi:methylphosphotriester-DNA--protein-cysteine methyltransferase
MVPSVDVKPLLQPFPILPQRRVQAWRYQPSYRRPSHFHAEPEVNLVLRGHGHFQVGERSFAVKRGSLLVLPPGIDHELVDASADLEFFAVGFGVPLVEAYRRESGDALRLAVGCHALGEPEFQSLGDLCHALSDDPSHRVCERSMFELLRRASVTRGSSVLGARAASMIRDGSVACRDALARTLGSNRGDVSRFFHRDNGLTLRVFRNRIRVLEFLRHVGVETRHLTRAAHLAGFGSYSQCHRVFCDVLGASPKEFLESGLRDEQASRFEPLEASVRTRVTTAQSTSIRTSR